VHGSTLGALLSVNGETTPGSVVVILGNGLSIAANSKLSMTELTSALKARLEGKGEFGAKFLGLLSSLARRSGKEEGQLEDFEAFLGGIYYHFRALEEIGDWWADYLENDSQVIQGFNSAGLHTYRLAQRGLREILMVILEESSPTNTDMSAVRQVVRALTATPAKSINFFNLNFDDILYRELISSHGSQLWDIADGRGLAEVVRFGEKSVTGRTLRKKDVLNPDGRRIGLYHPHGSLLFWSESKTDQFVKLSRNDVENLGLLDLRISGLDFRPLVLMGWQELKNFVQDDYPFNFAFNMLVEKLRSSPTWQILGFSFRDEHIVQILKREAKMKLQFEPLFIFIVDLDSRIANEAFIREKLDLLADNNHNFPVTIQVVCKSLQSLEPGDLESN
jgi:hypothetical protein